MVLTDKHIAGLKAMLNKALLDEWKAQGHHMTGAVVQRIEYEVERTFGAFAIVGRMPAYGGYIQEGVQAGNIPFAPGSGAGKSKYIEGLMAYVEKRMGISDLQTKKSVAFAIAHTQKREGMPTRGSYQYSNTGQRTNWINIALDKNQSKIGLYIRQFYRQYLQTEFTELITTYGKTI